MGNTFPDDLAELTSGEVAELTGWSTTSIQRWATTGLLPSTRKLRGRTGARLFRWSDVKNFTPPGAERPMPRPVPAGVGSS